jgi:hypothetical protein
MPQVEPFIRETKFPGITLNDLLRKHGVEDFELLHIDTEGADFAILSQLDLKKYQPKLILYESKHLTKDEESASVQFLEDYYLLFNLGEDILAVNKKTEKNLLATLYPLREHRMGDAKEEGAVDISISTETPRT